MRVLRAALAGGMIIASIGFLTKPAIADMQMGTSEMPMGTTCRWGVSLAISAQNNAFDRDCLAAPPGERFTIAFDNKDSVGHNLVILTEHDSAVPLFRGEVITGPGSVTYTVDPLPLGTYHFHCELHPSTMMGRFVLGGPAAATSPGMMAMASPPGMSMAAGGPSNGGGTIAETGLRAQPALSHRGSSRVRSIALLLGVACCAAGLAIVRSKRRPRRTGDGTSPATTPASSRAPDNVGRRDLVRLGAAGVAGAALAKLATSQLPAGATDRLGGIHINVLTKGVSPAIKDFPHHFTITVYGPDNALSGMGWGGALDVKTQQDVLNSKMLQCIFSLAGAVEGDIVKLQGLMLFAGDPADEGLPLIFEANLRTGALHCNAYHTLDLEGTGLVARI
jgi:plastocyanin